jgi:hypothetical protein
MKLLDSVILFSGFAFLSMFVSEVLYKQNSFKDNYFFLMFGISLVLTFVYRYGQRKIEEKKRVEIKKEASTKKIEQRIKKKR